MNDFEQRLAASMKQLVEHPIDLDLPVKRRGAKTGVLAAVLVAASVASVFFLTGGFDRSTDHTPIADQTRPTQYPTVPPAGDTATWKLAPDQDLNEHSTQFTALVTRLGCNGGVTGKVVGPSVRYRDNEIVVWFAAAPQEQNGYAYTCQGNDRVPVVVHLEHPLGDSSLVDGQCAAMPTAKYAPCRWDHGVRWRGTEPVAINLEGEWKVTALLDADGKSVLPATLVGKVRIDFGAVSFTGTTGCNGFQGNYQLSGPRGEDLIFSHFTGSQVGCGDGDALTRLGDVRHASEANGELHLQDVNGKNIAILERDAVEQTYAATRLRQVEELLVSHAYKSLPDVQEASSDRGYTKVLAGVTRKALGDMTTTELAAAYSEATGVPVEVYIAEPAHPV